MPNMATLAGRVSGIAVNSAVGIGIADNILVLATSVIAGLVGVAGLIQGFVATGVNIVNRIALAHFILGSCANLVDLDRARSALGFAARSDGQECNIVSGIGKRGIAI